MRRRLLLLAILTTLNFCCYAQTSFETGYFISQDDQRIDCLIENLDWKNNPTEFKYKLVGSLESKKADINDVKEFGVLNISKYIRANVNLDRSGAALASNTHDKNPVFREEQLFLKVLIEGKASLFLYQDENLTRFFYKTNTDITQLIYKEYLTYENSIGKNNFFRQQLYNDLNCQNVTINELEDISYSQRHLERVFIKYNECTNSQYVDCENRKKKDVFNLTIRPGLNNSSLSIDNPSSNSRDTDFKNSISFRLGMEAEFILGFNNNKWAIIVEPTYQSFGATKTTQSSDVSGGTLTATVDYNSIEFPAGLRHYFFLNQESKIFVNAAFVADFSLGSDIRFTRSDGSVLSTLDIKSRPNLAFGVGYKLNNRYSVEMRYLTNRNILSDYLYLNSAYKTLSVAVGYSF